MQELTRGATIRNNLRGKISTTTRGAEQSELELLLSHVEEKIQKKTSSIAGGAKMKKNKGQGGLELNG